MALVAPERTAFMIWFKAKPFLPSENTRKEQEFHIVFMQFIKDSILINIVNER
jgi:hypothetical protein